MKRISMTISDEGLSRLLSAIAEHPVVTLNVDDTAPPGADEREAAAAYLLDRGKALQAEGVRNSQSTTEKLAAELRAGMHRPSMSTAVSTYLVVGGGASDEAGPNG